MTEADITQDLLKVLKSRLPGADVWKIADRSTIGRPDVAITWRGFTSWLEVKLLRQGDSLDGCSPELQRFMMQRLHCQSGGRAWYVVYDARKKRERFTAIYEPALLVDNEDAPLLLTSGFDHEQVARFLEER